MKSLNSQIDTMLNETIYHVEADNSRRIKKLTIRFTKSNQKYSHDHLESLLSSYEKAISEIPRQFLRVEKSARQKYLVPLDEDRQKQLLKVMVSHVEMLVEKMNREYRDIFNNQKRLDEFDNRIKSSLIDGKRRIDKEIRKVSESLEKTLNSSSKVKPEELAKIYNLDESTLIDLKAIEPLQSIHEVFEGLHEDHKAKTAFEGLKEGIIICSKFGTQVEINPTQNKTEAARRLKKRSLVAGTLALKGLIDSVYILTQQLKLPIEKRNNEIVVKTCNRLNEHLKGNDGAEKVLGSLKVFLQMLSIN